MLRRKLILLLFSVTGLLMALALAALLSLQTIFANLDHIQGDARRMVDVSNQLSASIYAIELQLHELQSGRQRHLDALIENVELMRRRTRSLRGHDMASQPAIQQRVEGVIDRLEQFSQHVEVLATTHDPELSARYEVQLLEAAGHLRDDILHITRFGNDHAHALEVALTRRFRWIVVGLGIGFLLVINTSMLLLLRASVMILRPVERLVDASRRLALEQFDHRVDVDQSDEFGELATAFNRLAAQLQENEQRKVETLHQTAATLNHELNNAMATIELQLRLLSKRAGRPEAFEACLKQIRQNLARMAQVVEAVKHVRRVVVTDYADGIKMLDLEQSVKDAPTGPTATDAVR